MPKKKPHVSNSDAILNIRRLSKSLMTTEREIICLTPYEVIRLPTPEREAFLTKLSAFLSDATALRQEVSDLVNGIAQISIAITTDITVSEDSGDALDG